MEQRQGLRFAIQQVKFCYWDNFFPRRENGGWVHSWWCRCRNVVRYRRFGCSSGETTYQYRPLLKLFRIHTPDGQVLPRACLLSYATYPPSSGVRAKITHVSRIPILTSVWEEDEGGALDLEWSSGGAWRRLNSAYTHCCLNLAHNEQTGCSPGHFAFFLLRNTWAWYQKWRVPWTHLQGSQACRTRLAARSEYEESIRSNSGGTTQSPLVFKIDGRTTFPCYMFLMITASWPRVLYTDIRNGALESRFIQLQMTQNVPI